MARALVALVGRPNVGKSRLFNRLVGTRHAIVEDVPGTTRDRIYGRYNWNGREVSVVDTGGLTSGRVEDVIREAMEQAATAIDEADIIVMVVDIRVGVTPLDEEVAARLRASGKPVLLAVNKADNRRQMDEAYLFHGLALGDLIPVSAERGLGTGELLDAIDRRLPESLDTGDDTTGLRVAIVGRPNVGKSSIVNAILGQRRLVVAAQPGTTRDAIDTTMRYHGSQIVLIDTAGIRRRGRIEQGIERYSVLRAHRAIERADVAVLVVDATEPLAAQDAHVAGFVVDEGKGLVVAVNKWDLIEKGAGTINQFERRLREELQFVSYAPMVFVSAVKRQRIGEILRLSASVGEERRKRVATGRLNDILRQAVSDFPPPSRQGKRLNLLYATQVGVEPPTFVLFVSDPKLVHFSYRRFLENRLREQFGFMGSPLRLSFRASREGAGAKDRAAPATSRRA